jgi:chorismate lyase/3-hydroxybenzoate synthase
MPTNSPVLDCLRVAFPASVRAHEERALGSLVWGAALDSEHQPLLLDGIASPFPALEGDRAFVDEWVSSSACVSGQTAGVSWRTDGCWTLGHVDVSDATGLEEVTRLAYLSIFEALRASGCLYLLRIWNFLPRINEEEGGSERYRQFNIGRQNAFLEAGYDAFEGAPAACALGSFDSVLRIRFLASSQPGLPIENPRQIPAYRYSAVYGPRSPTFSRAVACHVGSGRVALWLSGTASIVGETSLHAGEVLLQVDETLRNVQTVIDQCNGRLSSGRFRWEDLSYVIYVRHPADIQAVRARIEAALPPHCRAMREAVYVQADICRSNLLVEIEGHAVTAAQMAAHEAAMTY